MAGVLDVSGKTSDGFGGVARPFLSDEIARVDALFGSVELFGVVVDFCA